MFFRIHGEKTELFINRETEIRNVQILSDLGIAAKLYGTFTNGIAYEFIPGEVLTSVTVSSPDVFPHVASAMAAMHKAIPREDQPPCLWKKLHEFCDLSPDGFPEDPVKDERYKSQVMSKKQRQQEIEQLEELLKSSNSPIVFCHNDALLVIILFLHYHLSF
jgi:ethanolamine kinase